MAKERDKQNDDLEPDEVHIPPLSQWSSVMDEIIAQAVNEGFFDNLPGKGKPLKLRKDPYGQEQELAFQLLKHNEYTLPWISERTELLQAIENLREEIRTTWVEYQGEYSLALSEVLAMGLRSGWNHQVGRWVKQIKELNKCIDKTNMKLPVSKLEIFKFNIDSELSRAGANRDLD